ncbi:MAG: DNA-directed RNA polymerase subunit D [Halobacteriaceae archaeon]
MTQDYEVEVIDHDDRELDFLVRGISPAFANGLRRAIIADVPTMSIDNLRVIENSSVMFDEQIALRLGLIPLTTDVDEFDMDETVTLSLDVEGPGTAYSGDLVSSDPLVEPADKNIPIIELHEGQRIELEADAQLGYGRDHSKNQGGIAVGYRHLQRVESVDDREEWSEEDETEIVRGVIEDDGELIQSEEFDHDLSNRYPDSNIEVEDVNNAFVFHVESDGSMPVSELVTRSVETLHDRAIELEEKVSL